MAFNREHPSLSSALHGMQHCFQSGTKSQTFGLYLAYGWFRNGAFRLTLTAGPSIPTFALSLPQDKLCLANILPGSQGLCWRLSVVQLKRIEYRRDKRNESTRRNVNVSHIRETTDPHLGI